VNEVIKFGVSLFVVQVVFIFNRFHYVWQLITSWNSDDIRFLLFFGAVMRDNGGDVQRFRI